MRSSSMIFCQMLRDRPLVSDVISLTASRATESEFSKKSTKKEPRSCFASEWCGRQFIGVDGCGRSFGSGGIGHSRSEGFRRTLLKPAHLPPPPFFLLPRNFDAMMRRQITTDKHQVVQR